MWLNRLFKKSAITTSAQLAEALGAAIHTSHAGVAVSDSKALTCSAVFSCVRVLAESVAQLPLNVYRRIDDGREVAKNHRLQALLHEQPNEWQTSQQFRQQLTAHAAIRGNGYAHIVRNGRGDVAELNPILPQYVTVDQDDNGVITYKVSDGKRTETFAKRDILHYSRFTIDGLIGVSPVTLARNAIGMALALEQFGGQMFSNGARPSGVLQTDGKLTEEQAKRLRDSWESTYSGLSNSGRVAVLEAGLKWQQTSMSAEDAEFLASRKFQIAEIARIYGVPAHMVGDLERATFSNIEHQSLQFVQHTLMPWLVAWEQIIQRDLIGRGQPYFAKHNVSAFLRGDTTSRSALYTQAIQNGWMTRNEVRGLEEMNPLVGGDVPLVPSNMTLLDGSNLESG